jgi:sterol desaturase/sphingolipid hydroxylase (fatty acid hydroxylase superfamily)
MVEKVMLYLNIISYILFFIFIFVEYKVSKNKKNNVYELQDTMFNIGTGIFYVIFPVVIVTSIILFMYEIFSQFAFFQMPGVWSALITGEKTYWWAFVLLIFVDDFCYYWFHRISHVCRCLWCIHEVHHSSKEYNLTVFLRASFIDYAPQGLFYIPVFLLGFRLEDVLFQMSLNFIYQFWLHTKYTNRIYLLDSIFNTPSHHRVHHAKNIAYLDKNYGGIFIIWDKIFGTFAKEEEKVEYGVLHDLQTKNWFKLNLEHFKLMYKDSLKTQNIFYKILYFIHAPGWSHDSSSKTTKQMQKEYFNNNQQNKNINENNNILQKIG